MSPKTPLRASQRGRRVLAGGTVAALTAGLLAFAPQSALAADPVAPTLQWKVSDQFVAHFTPNPAFSPFTSLVATDGATIDETTKVTSFGNGAGFHDQASGTSHISYEGSVTGSFITGTVSPGTLQYTLTIADPTVIVDAAGAGRIEADVAWNVPSSTPATGSTEDVTVVTFDAGAADWSSADGIASLTETPDFLGVLPADSTTATDLGIPSGKPTNGGSFDPEFLAALNPGLRAHFYLSGSASGDPRKPASPFTASVAGPEVSTSTTESVPGSLKVQVDGSGFSKTGVGIYVSLGEEGAFSPTNAAAFVTTNWLNAAAINVDGSFSTTLSLADVDIAKLDPTKSYVVYTQKAHGQSATDPSQNTETPITIDFDSLKPVSPAIKATGLTTTYGKGGSVVVTAPSAGKVTVAGLGSKTVAAAGAVGFAVPKTQAVGTKSYLVSFVPADSNVTAPANVTVVAKVAKATAAKPTVKVNKKPTSKKAGKVTVKVKGIAGVTAPTGKVTVRFTKGKSVKTKTVTLSKGSRTVAVPKLKKGTWKITVRYAGDSRYTPRAYVSAGKVKVTK